MKITPNGWREFQHYKDRNPPWIRLHRKLLDNKDFNALPPMACKVLVLLWLVASDTPEGLLDDNADDLAFRLRLPVKDVAAALSALKSSGFLIPADAGEAEADDRPLSKQIAERNGFGSRHISDKVKREVWERDGAKCCNCDSTENLEFDHKTPVSKGGNSEAENIQLLCRPCNRKKRVKTAEQVATPAQPWLGIRTTEAEALQRQSITETETVPRATRLPSPFVLSDEWREWAKAERPDLDPLKTAAKFADYWHGKPGRGGTKLDWLATWRNWVREERVERRAQGAASVIGVTVPSDGAARTQEYIQSMKLTPEQREASDAARRLVMSAVKRIA